MIVPVSYAYPITYVPFGHRNEMTAWGKASTIVDIREVPADEAPVMVLLGQPTSFRMSAKFSFKPDGTLREIRRFEGDLYVEHSAATVLEKEAEANIDRSILSLKHSTLDLSHRRRISTSETVIAEQKKPLRRITDDGGESIAKRLQAKADRLLAIDGTIYRKCREPILAIGVDGTSTLREAPMERSYVAHSMLDGLTAVTANVVEAERILSHDIGRRLHPHESAPKWQIVDPEFASFDGTTFDIMRHVAAMLYSLKQGSLMLLRNHLDLMFALRDATGRSPDRLSEEIFSVIDEIRDIETDEAERAKAMNCFAVAQQFNTSAAELVIKRRSEDNQRGLLLERLAVLCDKISERLEMKPAGWTGPSLRPDETALQKAQTASPLNFSR